MGFIPSIRGWWNCFYYCLALGSWNTDGGKGGRGAERGTGRGSIGEDGKRGEEGVRRPLGVSGEQSRRGAEQENVGSRGMR